MQRWARSSPLKGAEYDLALAILPPVEDAHDSGGDKKNHQQVIHTREGVYQQTPYSRSRFSRVGKRGGWNKG